MHRQEREKQGAILPAAGSADRRMCNPLGRVRLTLCPVRLEFESAAIFSCARKQTGACSENGTSQGSQDEAVHDADAGAGAKADADTAAFNPAPAQF